MQKTMLELRMHLRRAIQLIGLVVMMSDGHHFAQVVGEEVSVARDTPGPLQPARASWASDGVSQGDERQPLLSPSGRRSSVDNNRSRHAPCHEAML